MTASNGQAATLLLDCHVHFHECFEARRFFDAAASNAGRLGGGTGRAGTPVAVLFLVDAARQRGFERAAALAGSPSADPWRVRTTDEPGSLLAERAGHPTLVLVAGRQVETLERLELLALHTTHRFADGRPLRQTLEEVLDAGALAAIPWGFGKWWFRRGAVLDATLDEVRHPRLFLGDNGGRLAAAPVPRRLREAARRGLRVLAGSDPLPFPREVSRVAGYACGLAGALDLARPARSVVDRLLADAAQPPLVGRLQRLPAFCFSQLQIQLRKRRRLSRSAE